jgi:uncharacterized protein
MTMKRCASLLVAMLFTSLLFAAPATAPATVGWSTLKTLNVAQPHSPANALNNQMVTVPGFMVPLEDDADQVTEFLLVPFAGACIHVPHPPPKQMIYVKLQRNQKTKMSFTEPIMVTGRLHVAKVDSPYGDVSFSLDGDTVRPYEQ